MNDARQDKYIVLATTICFTIPFVFQILSVLIYPPDFSGEYPIYPPEGILLLQLAGAFILLGLTVIGHESS